MEDNVIVNRVAGSGLVTLNLEDHYPRVEVVELDLKDQLVEGLMLREKDLREFVRIHDWAQYQGKWVAVFCSTEAIIPTWAFMLVAIALQPYAQRTIFGNRAAALGVAFHERLDAIDWKSFQGAKVVVKGCSDVHVPESVFVETATRLRDVAASILYGEPCSTVPLYKRPKAGG